MGIDLSPLTPRGSDKMYEGDYKAIIGTGGIGSGMMFELEGRP